MKKKLKFEKKKLQFIIVYSYNLKKFTINFYNKYLLYVHFILTKKKLIDKKLKI